MYFYANDAPRLLPCYWQGPSRHPGRLPGASGVTVLTALAGAVPRARPPALRAARRPRRARRQGAPPRPPGRFGRESLGKTSRESPEAS